MIGVNPMLGKRLKELRGKRTQEEIANKLGLSRARYSHYENGRSEPDTEMLQKMADFFGVSVDYLLGRTDNPNLGNEQENLFFFNKEGLSEEDLALIREHIEFVRAKARKRAEKNKKQNEI